MTKLKESFVCRIINHFILCFYIMMYTLYRNTFFLSFELLNIHSGYKSVLGNNVYEMCYEIARPFQSFI